VDELYAEAPAHGATLIGALFPRSYLDPNRGVEDIDEALIDGKWPTPLKPSQKTRSGLGLVRRVARSTPIYDRKLSVDEVLARIERCHTPCPRRGMHAASCEIRYGLAYQLPFYAVKAKRPRHRAAGRFRTRRP
jgi:N-formylglutamate amidohydrolase